MNLRSLYHVSTQVVSLFHRPFLTSKKIRRPFTPIFKNKNCFLQLRNNIYTPYRPGALPPVPFIKNVGVLCANSRSAIFCNREYPISNFPILLTGYAEPWKDRPSYSLIYDHDYSSSGRLFGIDILTDDYRMQNVYFETFNSLNIIGYDNSRRFASGKVFLHIYPSGYLILHCAISLNVDNLNNSENLVNAIKECRPWSISNKIVWSSKYGHQSLDETISCVLNSVFSSIFEDNREFPQVGEWSTSIKIVNRGSINELVTVLFRDKYDYFPLSSFDQLEEDTGIYLSSQGLIIKYEEAKLKSSALHSFWKINTVNEFIVLISKVFDDYIIFLSHELPRLKTIRRNFLSKMEEEEIYRLNIYDANIPKYLGLLSFHPRTLNPFYRKVYSSIVDGYRLSEKRDKLKNLVEEWEAEIDLWEPGLKTIWMKLISPIKSIFS